MKNVIRIDLTNFELRIFGVKWKSVALSCFITPLEGFSMLKTNNPNSFWWSEGGTVNIMLLELRKGNSSFFSNYAGELHVKKNEVLRLGGKSWSKHTHTPQDSNKKLYSMPHHYKTTKPARAKNFVRAPRTADSQVLLHRHYTKRNPSWLYSVQPDWH
jgi:hypothetical protein